MVVLLIFSGSNEIKPYTKVFDSAEGSHERKRHYHSASSVMHILFSQSSRERIKISHRKRTALRPQAVPSHPLIYYFIILRYRMMVSGKSYLFSDT